MKRLFTLIELLVVVAIIGVLASLLLPALQNARDRAKALLCLSVLKQHGTTLNMYASDCDDVLPGSPVSGASTEWEYLFSTKITPGGLCMADYYGIDVSVDRENGWPVYHSNNYNTKTYPLTKMQKFCCPAFISRWRNSDITFYEPSGTQYKEAPNRRGYTHAFTVDYAAGTPYRGSPGWRRISKIGSQGPVSPTATSGWSTTWSLRASPSRLVVICDYKFNRDFADQAIPYHRGNGHRTGYGYLTMDGGAKLSSRFNTSNTSGWDDRPPWVLGASF